MSTQKIDDLIIMVCWAFAIDLFSSVNCQSLLLRFARSRAAHLRRRYYRIDRRSR